MRTRSGFTIVEVLVVITVLALLAALILPAVQSARESSRRAQCRAHMLGFGQALHHFESANRRFPPILPGADDEMLNGRVTTASDKWYSPHVQLLPYLDQQVLFNQFDLTQAYEFPSGAIHQSVEPVRQFRCPSDWGNYGTNYRFCTGAHATVTGGGMFTELRGHSSGGIKDGFTNTAVVSEAIKSDMNAGRYGRGDYWVSGVAAINWPVSTAEVISACSSLSTPPPPGYFFPFAGHTWAVMGYDYTLYNHAVTPNSPVPDCAADARRRSHITPWGASLTGVHKASSQHSGGVNVLMMDGSVRFVADSVDLIVWRSIATIAGEEVVDGAAL